MTSADPLGGIHVAVNRVSRRTRAPARPFLPEQASRSRRALAAYTAGSAYVNHLDDTGTIAPGNLADLAVLDRDPFAGPADEIATPGWSRRTSAGGGCTPHPPPTGLSSGIGPGLARPAHGGPSHAPHAPRGPKASSRRLTV